MENKTLTDPKVGDRGYCMFEAGTVDRVEEGVVTSFKFDGEITAFADMLLVFKEDVEVKKIADYFKAEMQKVMEHPFKSFNYPEIRNRLAEMFDKACGGAVPHGLHAHEFVREVIAKAEDFLTTDVDGTKPFA